MQNTIGLILEILKKKSLIIYIWYVVDSYFKEMHQMKLHWNTIRLLLTGQNFVKI